MGHDQADADLLRFHCDRCGLVTRHDHYNLHGVMGERTVPLPTAWSMSCCSECDTVTVYYELERVVPPRLVGQFDGDGLPAAIATELRCALATVIPSPRASAAHARAALYAMLAEGAARRHEDPTLPADELFVQLIPAREAALHALFRDMCLRDGALLPAGVHGSAEPLGVASALVDLVRQVKALLF